MNIEKISGNIIDFRRSIGVCVLCGNRSPGGHLHKNCDEAARMSDEEFDIQNRRVLTERENFIHQTELRLKEINELYNSSVGTVRFVYLNVDVSSAYLWDFNTKHNCFVVVESCILFDRCTNSELVKNYAGYAIQRMQKLHSDSVEISVKWK